VLFGYKGKLLHIDLSAKSWKTTEISEPIINKYIGGRGLAAKLFWDLMPASIDALSPPNVFMVLTGPLTGTMVPGAGKHLIVTKSPSTGGWLESYSSGRLGPEIKFAGFDGIIITGRANRPIYLVVENHNVSIRNAEYLWGKGAFWSEAALKRHFGFDSGTLVIGPAGENLVPFACVGSEYFRKAGRGGAGAVMGSKNLKGLVVKGSEGIRCADVKTLHRLVLQDYEKYKASPVGRARRRYGTPLTMDITNGAGMLPTHNFSRGQFNQAIGKIDKNSVESLTERERACYACFMSCSKRTSVKKGSFKGVNLEGPEYETLAMLGANLEVDYLPAIMKANYECDDLGLDTISTGAVISFAMECFEQGIISAVDTGGLRLNFGNYEAVLELLEMIATKKGFGAFCAKGVRAMAKAIGKGTKHFAMHSKGLEMPGYDPRGAWGSALTYAVTPRGACHRRAWPPTEVIQGLDPYTIKGKAKFIRDLMNENCIMHSLIVCDMGGKFIPLAVNDYRKYLKVVTGRDVGAEKLNERSEIIETLIRRINVREGLSEKDDVLPRRILEEALPEGPAKGKRITSENFLRMRNEYYKLRGWDERGKPTQETVDKYGFDGEERMES